MRSRAAARRTKRRVRWDALLLLLLAANLGAAIWNSPLLPLRRIRVVGAQPEDRDAIDAIVQHESGIAALAVNVPALECSVQRLPEIERAAFSVNVFGSARLNLRYRTPVARIGHSQLALDHEGRIWKTRQSLAHLPSVRLPAKALTARLALARSAPVCGVAALAESLPRHWPDFKGEIALDGAGTVCLNRGDSGRVVLGGAEAMDEKLSKLAGLLRERPELFTGAIEVNLTAPSHPVFSHVSLGHPTAD
ncbi:MAG TPA: hypothetical protein VKT78_19245 [Fimbriimonadaceae bacterium]|nr:hypothetical protein [Fimbriimonadaceae bacterium]